MFNFEKINPSAIVKLGSVEKVVEFTPNGVDSEKVAKILSLCVDGKTLSATASDGYVEVEGRAEFKLLYIDTDNNLQGVNYNADFNVRIDGDVNADDYADCKITVSESDINVGESITLSAVVNVDVCAIKTCEIEYLNDAKDCLKTTSSKDVCELIFTKNVVLPIEDEKSVGEIGKVLFLSAESIVKNAEAKENSVAVEVLTYATVTYTQDGKITTSNFEIVTEESIDADGTKEGDKVLASATIKKSRIVLAGVTGENILRFESDVNLKIKVFRNTETQFITDVFSLTNELALSSKQCNNDCFSKSNIYTQKIDGIASLDNGKTAKDIIAIPSASVFVAKAIVDEDGTMVDGIVIASVIYENDEGVEDSAQAEIPFSVHLKGDFCQNVCASAVATNVSAKIKHSGEIDFDIDIMIKIDEFCECSFDYIDSVEVGEQKQVNSSGLSLYIAEGGDTLWDVCKALTATPEKIVEQNDALTFPLNEGDKVLFFRNIAG